MKNLRLTLFIIHISTGSVVKGISSPAPMKTWPGGMRTADPFAGMLKSSKGVDIVDDVNAVDPVVVVGEEVVLAQVGAASEIT